MAHILLDRVTVGNPAMDIPLRKYRGVEEVRVTPEMAQKWLTFNTANREMTQSKIDQFKTDMECGYWNDDGATVRFGYGKLLDGQHRLSALAIGGVTLRMLIVYGLDNESQVTMDTGRGRTPRDVLSIEGLGQWESATLGSAMHQIMAYESGLALFSVRKFTNREVRNYYLEHRSGLEATVQACKAYPRKGPIVPHARTMAVHYLLSKIDSGAATKFFGGLLVGDLLTRLSPVFYLRERLLSDLHAKKSRGAYEQLYYIVKAWNSVRRGGTVKSQNFMLPRDGDAFPEIAK
jgi:hypothetical protein